MSDGGESVQSFLHKGLIADRVISLVPVLIGSGRALFAPFQQDIEIKLVSSRCFPSGW